MRISTITNWAYSVTLVLTAVSAAAFIVSARAALDERVAVEQNLKLDALAEELEIGAEKQSEEARLYVMRGDEQHLAAFYIDENQEHQIEKSIEQVKALGLTRDESSLIEAIRADIDTLDGIERKAIETYKAGNAAAAQQMLFGDEHYGQHSKLLTMVGDFRRSVTARADARLGEAQQRSDFYGLVARIVLGITAALFLAVLYFVLKRRVAMPLTRMTGIVTRLAKQDYEVEVPRDSRRDEIGEMNEAIEIFRSNSLERDRLDAERRRDQQTKDLILQMMHRLQACQTQAELAEVVARFAPQIFPNLAGHLFALNRTRSALILEGSWHGPTRSSTSFSIEDCWGLRRGRPHVSHGHGGDVACHHLSDEKQVALCVPLTALGDTVGLLYFEERPGYQFAADAARLYLELIAENIGLAVANLQLRDRLTDLAIRDPLTGLLNRRSLDEALNRHASTATPLLVCLMIDIDYFKRFNDQFGHDAGDAVMQYVARIQLETLGDAGQVYRFGGEEFTVLLPGIAQDAGIELAEKLRRTIERSPFSHRGRILGNVTVSIGAASVPAGGPLATLLERADAALLEAKETGRNRTVIASEEDIGFAPGAKTEAR